MNRIGFIGVGAMGHWMVKRLLDHQLNVTVFDSNPEALEPFLNQPIGVARSVTELGENCNIVILMLPDSQIVKDVILGNGGLITSLSKESIIIDMGSSYPVETQKIATILRKETLRFVDAPVSGGVRKAISGELTVMVGAEEADYDEIEPILKYLGTNIRWVGQSGSGHALKSINNYLSASSMYATAEAMVLLKKMDIELNTALEIINESTGQSHSTSYKYPTFILPRTFNSNFSLKLLLKDIKMAKSLANDVHMPMLLGSSLVEIYEAAHLMGGEDQDHTEIIKFLEQLAKQNLFEGEKSDE
ncbi:NAD(P)-dependent oxidoreductase [Geomicrobium sp. JCM 19037]|uniref:NAD(P)-dependent oxidoreductase n=1 Tax=Geomicrobium sp. JCM 19037 TaxID=1460634 RepID=UPI0006939908|nr:NAD(P)-dependent oxidoreductase [Geomicrobium sp. JCM 19037]